MNQSDCRPRFAPRRPGERGAVLVIVMLVMFALLGLGVTALWLTSGGLQIGATTNLRNQALYVAEAGLEAARADLNRSPARDLNQLLAGGQDLLLDDLPSGTGVDATGSPNGIGAVYFLASGTRLRDVAFPPASFARGVDSTANAPASTTMGSYTVWIRNDLIDLRQGNLTNDSNGSIVLRARGVAVDGRTEVVLEATLGGGATPPSPPVLCNAGKNACDENSSMLSGVYAN